MNEKPKILIADDSEINRALLKEILGDGYDYLEAEDGAAAVELMRQRTDISLLLLDLMMPGMDGFDVLRVMKYHAWLDEIPVIVISAAEDTANIERAYDLGVADYIRRPFERIMIIRRVKNILMLYAKQKRLTRLVTDQVFFSVTSTSVFTPLACKVCISSMVVRKVATSAGTSSVSTPSFWRAVYSSCLPSRPLTV